MSKVVIRTHYSFNGKSVGRGFTNYISRRDRVDKTINARRSEVFSQYAAERPGVITMGEHGLFGQENYVRDAIYDNKKNDLYTDKEQGSLPYGGIVFAICKMFEQSIDYDIKEGFTKSIVDSKERTKEYRKDSAMGIHHGM